jgi:hypothetical protein
MRKESFERSEQQESEEERRMRETAENLLARGYEERWIPADPAQQLEAKRKLKEEFAEFRPGLSEEKDGKVRVFVRKEAELH